MAVLSLLDRDTKRVRSFHVDEVTTDEVTPIVSRNLSKEAHLMTDQGRWFRRVGNELGRHETVSHEDEEYVRYVTTPQPAKNTKSTSIRWKATTRCSNAA
jgi:hypothetical protein